MPTGPQAHRLGPHSVGSRVVIRYLLSRDAATDAAAGATDVLGTCLAWGDGTVVVQPDAEPGLPPVRIPLAAVVTGKPVPPRTSPRLRVAPAAAQRRAMALFPGLETVEVDTWTLRRTTAHPARRANSALAMDELAELDPDAAVTAVEEFYRTRGARPIAAVLPGTAAEAAFRDRGWVTESHEADTVFMIGSVASIDRALPEPVAPVVLEANETTSGVVTASIGDRARGVAALDDDWVGFRGVEVDPAYRRRGLGLAVMAALVELAAERGATTAYLQVLGDNAPALAMYERLCFARHHEYSYLAAPV